VKAAAFDEWVANADRHNGNLLMGTTGEVWLIDHSHAFTGDTWTAAGLSAFGYTPVNKNQLAAHLAPLLQPGDHSGVMFKAEALEDSAAKIDVHAKVEESHASAFMSSPDSTALVSFLQTRRAHIASNFRQQCGVGVV